MTKRRDDALAGEASDEDSKEREPGGRKRRGDQRPSGSWFFPTAKRFSSIALMWPRALCGIQPSTSGVFELSGAGRHITRALTGFSGTPSAPCRHARVFEAVPF